ncbi:MAG: cupin domain-containing protein [Actinomycetota bacterium]|nr:cupin domain-containing protein [Actinomycetota bacterium]
MAADPTEPAQLIPYGAATLRVLAETQGLAIAEMALPPGFLSPPPAIHNGFDEAIYVLSGQITVVRNHDHARTVTAGGLFAIPRGTRHAFANEADQPAHVLGMWSPGSALRFVADIGAVLPATGYPDLAVLGEVYRRHHSELAV